MPLLDPAISRALDPFGACELVALTAFLGWAGRE
jgi:hypothetical protein